MSVLLEIMRERNLSLLDLAHSTGIQASILNLIVSRIYISNSDERIRIAQGVVDGDGLLFDQCRALYEKGAKDPKIDMWNTGLNRTKANKFLLFRTIEDVVEKLWICYFSVDGDLHLAL